MKILIQLQVYQIVKTSDGSHTVYVRELDEHYHSIHGAIQESNHIFIKNGFDCCESRPVNIFEVGFGTGLNALLTAARAALVNKKVLYTSIEKFPLEKEIINKLNHKVYSDEQSPGLFGKIHLAKWNTHVDITPFFSIKKIKADLTEVSPSGSFDLIYFDAFGPDKQPEMWTRGIFEKIAAITKAGCILVTYSAKGEVKRNLRAVGFEVALLPGPPGKRQIIRAIKI